MVNAVEIYNDELRCGTFSISQGFDREHHRVIDLIKKHKKRFFRLDNNSDSTGFIMRRVPVKKAGRPVDEIMLNEQQSIFLGTLFRNTERVLDFKERLAGDFVKQRKIINALMSNRKTPEWIKNRATGKIARKEETDTIKDFVKYAKIQGSKSADRYYVILSKCVNTNMFTFTGKFKNVREVMTATQLMDVKFADKIVSRGLLDGMAQGFHYKKIYEMVKERLITLADMYGQSEVISKQLELEDKE